MLDFILSKFGIMLFAVTIAGLLIMFSTDMKNIFIAEEGMKVSSVITKQISEMSNAESLCAFTYVALPKFIDILNGSNVTATSIYYYFDINVKEYDDEKLIVFSNIDKRNSKYLSIESYLTNAKIILDNDNENYLRIDPTKNNILMVVKTTTIESEKLIPKIYFLTCRYDKLNGMENCYNKLRELVKNEKATFCVPTTNPFLKGETNE